MARIIIINIIVKHTRDNKQYNRDIVMYVTSVPVSKRNKQPREEYIPKSNHIETTPRIKGARNP